MLWPQISFHRQNCQACQEREGSFGEQCEYKHPGMGWEAASTGSRWTRDCTTVFTRNRIPWKPAWLKEAWPTPKSSAKTHQGTFQSLPKHHWMVALLWPNIPNSYLGQSDQWVARSSLRDLGNWWKKQIQEPRLNWQWLNQLGFLSTRDNGMLSKNLDTRYPPTLDWAKDKGHRLML